MTLEDFRKAASLTTALAQRWFPHVVAVMAEFGISTPRRQAAFIAQIAHESAGFTQLSENLYYNDPARVAALFKTGFDLNKNGVADAAEIEFAKGYTRNPEKLANRAYAGRMGNGPESSGDGWKYRGRGLKQVTGKNNYLACGVALGLDLLTEPDLLLDDAQAARSAGWFWQANNLNSYADIRDFVGMTRRINGSTTGLAERTVRLKVAEAVLCH